MTLAKGLHFPVPLNLGRGERWPTGCFIESMLRQPNTINHRQKTADGWEDARTNTHRNLGS